MSSDELALSHTFIHPDVSAKSMRLLRKLTREQIEQLTLGWVGDHVEVAPPYLEEGDDDKDDGEEFEQRVSRRATEIQAELEQAGKTQLIHEIGQTYWPQGLNMFQSAQIETLNILENKPTNSGFSWVYSTLETFAGNLFVPSIQPSAFLENLTKSLHPLILGHAFVTTHSELALIVVRVQVFNPQPTSDATRLQPAKPIYIALPSSSPHIIHTHSDKFYTRAIAASLETTLSTANEPVRLKMADQVPVNSLHSLAFLKSNNRKNNALGAWSIYADNQVDKSPLDNRPLRQTSKNKHNKRRQIANRKFTGRDDTTSAFKSDHAMSIFEVKLNEPCRGTDTSVTVRFEGEDVFAGIHRLASEGVASAENLPLWMTGEEPHSSGVVSNGKFH